MTSLGPEQTSLDMAGTGNLGPDQSEGDRHQLSSRIKIRVRIRVCVLVSDSMRETTESVKC